MEEGQTPVFRYYREVIGKENIELVVVDEDDPLDFVKEGDVILSRTAKEGLIKTFERKGVITTSEKYSIVEKVADKTSLSKYLSEYGILTPKNYDFDSVVEGHTYFVKPRYGGESMGITPACICHSKADVAEQISRIRQELNEDVIIEDFIEGADCTVACYNESGEIRTHAIKVEAYEVGGIQTHVGKFDYNEYCSALKGFVGKKACQISKRVFKLLDIKHHARIDYRLANDGRLYLIDVNLLPGLGPSAHFSKCLLLTENISYVDTIMNILKSATK